MTGGYSVEQLMGRDVVGPDGNGIARVSDLLVEPDDRIRKVTVDVGGFLGIGARPVALDIAELRRRGDLHTSLTGGSSCWPCRATSAAARVATTSRTAAASGRRRAGDASPFRPRPPRRGGTGPARPRSSLGLLASGSARSCASSGRSRS